MLMAVLRAGDRDSSIEWCELEGSSELGKGEPVFYALMERWTWDGVWRWKREVYESG